jgi:DNA polymerase I-like protein with 3'-5' exonuclease and polymerase domains
VLDTETTALSIIDAQLVWISIYIDDKNTYYINRKHRWPAVSDKTLHNFIDFLLSSDILIIGHNIKYDLQILELFMKHHNNHDWEENSQESQNTQWQMSLL